MPCCSPAPYTAGLYSLCFTNIKFLMSLSFSLAVPHAGNVISPFATCPTPFPLSGLSQVSPLSKSLLRYPSSLLLRSGMRRDLCAPVASHASLWNRLSYILTVLVLVLLFSLPSTSCLERRACVFLFYMPAGKKWVFVGWINIWVNFSLLHEKIKMKREHNVLYYLQLQLKPKFHLCDFQTDNNH